MGMDVYGSNPQQNKSMKEFPTYAKIVKMRKEKGGWEESWKLFDDDKSLQETFFKEMEEYEDINCGIYFRNNCWWWRPLWNFCAHHCPELIDEETYHSGHHNDGAGLNAKDSVKLGTKLLALIEDGTASAHEKEIILSNEEAQAKDPDNGLAGAYPFSVENVKDFADFCIQSGGFEIC